MTKSKKRPLALVALIAEVREILPLHAEESGHRESVREVEVVAQLVATGTSQESATLLTGLLRRQLEALALLDRTELDAGRWAFVSFPASLLGRSLLEILSTLDHAILPTDYWEQGDHRPQEIKEQQRDLLHKIESARVQFNPSAHPVRTVHVAWAIIRVQDQFLLYRREDRRRSGEKTHVFPGGRFKLSDLPTGDRARPDVLRETLRPDSVVVRDNLHVTLTRELGEELDLLNEKHYSFEHWQDLPPYREVNGAGNRHAYTEYSFRLFTVKLTPSGELRLLDKEAQSPTELAWFSAAEIIAPQRANGDAAYVDALHKTWGKELASRLQQAPESLDSSEMFATESQMLDLPATPAAGIHIGKTGKEKNLSIRFTVEELNFLLLLGWHTRGFAIEHSPQCVTLLGRGWVHVKNENLLAVGRKLQVALDKRIPSLLEIRDTHYFSLRINPNILMFSPALFAYRIQGSNKDGGILTIQRKPIDTPWGRLGGEVMKKSVTGNTIRILRELERGDDPSGSSGVRAEDWEKNLREQFAGLLRALGLRRISTTKQGAALVEGLQLIKEQEHDGSAHVGYPVQ